MGMREGVPRHRHRQTACISVSAIVVAGNEVVFTKDGCFIRDVETGEQIHLRGERRGCTLEVSVDAVGVMGTDSGEGSGIIGQAQSRIREGWMQVMKLEVPRRSRRWW